MRGVLVALLAVLSAIAVRWLRRRNDTVLRSALNHPVAICGCWLLLFLILIALCAPWVTPYRPSLQLDILRMTDQPPSLTHPLGTDVFSRDIWTRLVYGARVSLSVGVLAMLVAVIVGATVGAISGYFGGSVDALLMRIVDVGLAIPRIFLVLVLIAVWTHLSIATLVLLLGLTGWFTTSRLVRAETLLLREQPFVQAARAMGSGAGRALLRHILPNVTAPVIVSAALGIGNVMLLEAALSFLGVGVQPPWPSWGNMIADGRDQLVNAPWCAVFPGIALALVVMALNAIGDGLRDALDPRTRVA